MFAFLARWFKPIVSEKSRNVRKYMLEMTAPDAIARNARVRNFIEHIQSDDFKWVRIGPMDYVSNCGQITLCNDIFGYEIHMLGGHELVDCNPGYYNLTHEQGRDIQRALADKFNARTLQDDMPAVTK